MGTSLSGDASKKNKVRYFKIQHFLLRAISSSYEVLGSCDGIVGSC